MNGDNAIQDSNEFNSKIIAYVILVIIDDWNVPPIDEQNAEQAAALKHDISPVTGANGIETKAPMVIMIYIQVIYYQSELLIRRGGYAGLTCFKLTI